MPKAKMLTQAKRLGERLVRLPRSRKRAVMLASDILFVPAALWSALALKLEGLPEGLGASPWLYVAALVTSIPIFVRLGLYRAVVRFIGAQAIVAVTAGVTASVVVLAIVNAVLPGEGLPHKALLIYWALALVYVGGTRILARNLMNLRPVGAERVVVYGAGAAGAQAVAALRSGTAYDPVAFRARHRRHRRGLGPGRGRARRGRERPARPRQRAARRAPVRRLHPRQVVMVTGAGGSIGSELCRQIIDLGAEAPRAARDVRARALQHRARAARADPQERLAVELVGLLGNAHHKSRVREILLAYGVQTVYHAAAYKHVPIVEQNIIEGIHNNVFSTWYTAEAALECGVETFVLISTDKAVNPTNVMGATKRWPKSCCRGCSSGAATTRFCMVRFGNVLESSGSVVPLFREQIRRGGPVTVTHPDVIRYFMTIPEASQLVIQAGSMAKGGDVFVLDMGKPIRIADLARRMISSPASRARDDEPTRTATSRSSTRACVRRKSCSRNC
jgi:FlaA1/EpsC-like NDP-sugar epimerase